MATLAELKEKRTQDDKFIVGKTYHHYMSYGVGFDEEEYSIPFHIVKRTEKSIWFWNYSEDCVEMKRLNTNPNGKEYFKWSGEYIYINYTLEEEVPHTIGGKRI